MKLRVALRAPAAALLAFVALTGPAPAAPERDLDLQDARLNAPGGTFSRREARADGAIVQPGAAFTLDAKSTDPRDATLEIVDDPRCASGEPRLAYELRPPSPRYRANTQKIMHRLHDDRGDQPKFGQTRRTSFEVRFPGPEGFEAPARGTRALIFQIWQGAPFQPPLALSVEGADAATVTLALHVNTPDAARERRELARLALPRETCLRVEVEARPTLPGDPGALVALRVTTAPPTGAGATLFDDRWPAQFGIDPANPRRFEALNCASARACRPARVFQVLFGLYRGTQDTLMRVEIGDVRHEATGPRAAAPAAAMRTVPLSQGRDP